MNKRLISFFAVIVLLFGLSACGSEGNKEQSETIKEEKSETITGETVKTNKGDNSKTAVVYFSATGKTKNVAEIIARETGADIFEIMPIESYTSDDLNYSDDSCRANNEQNDDSARPGIRNSLSEISEYDTVYLGYPIWWGTNPRIIQTFLEAYNLSGATIHLFCTSGSSGIDRSVSELQSAYPELKITDGKRFEPDAEEAIKNWTAENK